MADTMAPGQMHVAAARRVQDLPSLTSLRAFAALGVFAFHLSRWRVVSLPGMPSGYAGVAFFFVLSGFVLTWGYSAATSRKTFYLRRIARIYPAHLVMWLVVLTLPVTEEPISVATSALNLTLLQAWIPLNRWTFAMNGVTWTLSCEVAFYAAFPWLLHWAVRQSLRRVWIVAAAAFVSSSCLVLVLPHVGHGLVVQNLVTSLPIVRFPEFVLGVAAALSVRAGVTLPPLRLALPMLVATLLGAVVWPTAPNMNLWLTPFFVVVVWYATRRDSANRSGLLGRRPLVYAGKISFAFYLVHELVLINLLRPLGAGWGTAVVALALSCAAAVALHHLVEVPAQRWVVTQFGATRRRTPSEAVTV